MSYCTVDHVQALIPISIWDHTAISPSPTVAEVTAWLSDADAEIDSKVGLRYAVPITGSDALAVISSIAARIVAIRVWGKAFSAQTGDAAIPEDWRQARKLLDDLALGNASLSGASSLGGATGASPGAPSMTMREMREDPLQDVVADPIFTTDKVW